MRKLGLSDWASLAEIIGTIAVVASLLVVAYSIERNTATTSGQAINELYDANREIAQTVFANPELARIIDEGQTNFANLSDSDRRQFNWYVMMNLDIWERAIVRENEGMIGEQAVAGWHLYYHEFFKRSLSQELWDELKWNWTDPELFRRVEEAIADAEQ